jgi:hypothetical protein
MRRFVVATVCAGVLLFGAAPGFAQTASVTVAGAALSLTTSSFSFSNATLTGANQSSSASASSAWTSIDPRGTGASWAITVTGVNLTSAAGTIETTARTIGVGNLTLSTGSITAGTGSDAATGITGSTNLALTTSAQTLVSATADHKGTYTFTPSMGLTVPANAYRSNYSTVVGSSSLNAYSGTLTVTLA